MGVCPVQPLPLGASSASLPVLGSVVSAGQATPGVWQLAEEVPVALLINSRPFAVMMATPADIEDFAVGFALAEGLVQTLDQIRGLLVMPVENGLCADLAIEGDVPNRPRSLAGRSGCGLCGVQEIADAVRAPLKTTAPVVPSGDAIVSAFAALPFHQPMNAVNRSVHAAAYCASDGGILLAREDVGRHNALDKLIGAIARQKLACAGGIVVMTSRCSFELVQKVAAAGIGCLATLSAPTTLALSLAHQSGLLLAARTRDGVMLFKGNP